MESSKMYAQTIHCLGSRFDKSIAVMHRMKAFYGSMRGFLGLIQAKFLKKAVSFITVPEIEWPLPCSRIWRDFQCFNGDI
jgi:hypothetical protein